MKADTLAETDIAAISRRLTVIRTHAVGDNQADFARMLDINPSRWNNLERGWPLTLKLALLICRRVEGVTVGYITQGHTGDVPAPLRRQLADLEATLFPPAKGKRPSKR